MLCDPSLYFSFKFSFLVGVPRTEYLSQINLLVARIAYDILEAEHPEVLQEATKILKVFSDAKPTNTPKEKNYNFVECSTYADDIKKYGGSYQTEWHIADNPYFD